MRVSDRCRQVLVTTVPEETLLGAATRMNWYRVGVLPVYRHRLIGIVTERDVVTAVTDGADLPPPRSPTT